MNIEYHKWYSSNLNQEMELKVYGHSGRPALVFPAQAGRFYEYEDFGMVAALSGLIDAGRLQLYTVDSLDGQSWANWSAHPADRARRHDEYDSYIIHEVAPFIGHRCPESAGIITTGCSMGAFHAANFYFRHPDIFTAVVAISGLYQLSMFVGDYSDDRVYFNSPLAYLPSLNDPWFIDRYRQGQIIVCCGQGAWEDAMLADTYALKRILEDKAIPAWIDIWGHDVNHDWPWWRRMAPYFMDRLT